MKVARSLVLSLLFIGSNMHAMDLLPQSIPLLVSIGAIGYIKIASFFRNKRLDAIEKELGIVKQNTDVIRGDVHAVRETIADQGSQLSAIQEGQAKLEAELGTIGKGQNDLQTKVSGLTQAVDDKHVVAMDALEKLKVAGVLAADRMLVLEEAVKDGDQETIKKLSELQVNFKGQFELFSQQLGGITEQYAQLHTLLAEQAKTSQKNANDLVLIFNQLEQLKKQSANGDVRLTRMLDQWECMQQLSVAQLGVNESWRRAMIAYPPQKRLTNK